jgi:hypothetical protein
MFKFFVPIGVCPPCQIRKLRGSAASIKERLVEQNKSSLVLKIFCARTHLQLQLFTSIQTNIIEMVFKMPIPIK